MNIGVIYQAVPGRHPPLAYPLPPEDGEAHGEMVSSLVKKLVTGRVTPAVHGPKSQRGKNRERKEGGKQERTTWTLRKVETKVISHLPFSSQFTLHLLHISYSTHIRKERKMLDFS